MAVVKGRKVDASDKSDRCEEYPGSAAGLWRLSRSYYLPLLRAGVRIYEFTPGFLHAKCYVSDDRVAVVGSINMDYRSLFLHFE